jgi:hypothetical protein
MVWATYSPLLWNKWTKYQIGSSILPRILIPLAKMLYLMRGKDLPNRYSYSVLALLFTEGQFSHLQGKSTNFNPISFLIFFY